MLSATYYAQNYAGIIGASLLLTQVQPVTSAITSNHFWNSTCSSERPQHVTLGDGHSLSAIGTGNVAIELWEVARPGSANYTMCSMYQSYHTYNLLSASKVTEAGKKVEFHSTDCQIVDREGKAVAIGIRKGNLYYLSC